MTILYCSVSSLGCGWWWFLHEKRKPGSSIPIKGRCTSRSLPASGSETKGGPAWIPSSYSLLSPRGWSSALCDRPPLFPSMSHSCISSCYYLPWAQKMAEAASSLGNPEPALGNVKAFPRVKFSGSLFEEGINPSWNTWGAVQGWREVAQTPRAPASLDSSLPPPAGNFDRNLVRRLSSLGNTQRGLWTWETTYKTCLT